MARTAVTSPFRKAVGGNLVFNGNFEIAPTGIIPTTTQFRWIDGTAAGNSAATNVYGWGLESLTGTGGAVFDPTTKYSGSYSMKVFTSAVSSTVNVSQKANGTFQTAITPVSPSTSYTVTGRIKTSITSGTATTGAQLQAIELSKNTTSTTATNTVAQGIITTQDWTSYTSTFTTSATTRFIKMQLRLVNDGAATLVGDVWFDDITLTLTTPETRTAVSGPYRKAVTNMIPNGDFRYAPSFTAATTANTVFIDGTASGSTATSSPYRWRTSSVTSASAMFDPSVTYNGMPSMKLTTIGGTGTLSVAFGSLSTIESEKLTLIKVLPNTAYTLTGWCKTSGVATNAGGITIAEYSPLSVNPVVTTNTSRLSGTNDWTYLSLAVTTSVTTRYVSILLRNNVTGGDSDAWYADVRLDLTSGSSRSAA